MVEQPAAPTADLEHNNNDDDADAGVGSDYDEHDGGEEGSPGELSWPSSSEGVDLGRLPRVR